MTTIDALYKLINEKDARLLQIIDEAQRIKSKGLISYKSPFATEMALDRLAKLCNNISNVNDIDDIYISAELAEYFNSPYLAAKLLKLCVTNGIDVENKIKDDKVANKPHYKIRCTRIKENYTFNICYPDGETRELFEDIDWLHSTSLAIYLYCLMSSPADVAFDRNAFNVIAKLHQKKNIKDFIDNKGKLLNYFLSETNRTIANALNNHNPYNDNADWYLIKKNEQNLYEISLPKENIELPPELQ
jgi:hypothetical protein